MITAMKWEGADKAMAMCNPSASIKAMNSCLNKMASQCQTEGSRSIRQEYNLKMADVNKKLVVYRSRPADLRSTIEAKGHPIPLIYFNPKHLTSQNRMISRTVGRQFKRQGNRSQGVTVQIAKGKTVTLSHAFIATMDTGHMGVFMRVGKKRLKIREKAFVTVATLFSGKTTMPRIQQLILSKWPTIIKNELSFFMAKGH